MTATGPATTTAGQHIAPIGEGRYVRANGTDIHYVEAGQGEPLLLLHGGLASTDTAWNGSPIAWVSHMAAFAQHFRVIAPDTRGHGRTVNPERGAILHSTLVADIVALIEALGLERPLLCGFSDGGTIATLVGIRHPGLVRAIVNDAGYDPFNPSSPTFTISRQIFGGRPAATCADPIAAERSFDAVDAMRATFALMKVAQDEAQGPGYWQTLLAEVFDRWTQSPGYSFDDLATIAEPTLILVGDRDHFCSPEEAAIAYRKLSAGELAIAPATGHWINAQKVRIAIDFLRRHSLA
jgi:pimeloyl-ACP methyl ester carboxylesterase